MSEPPEERTIRRILVALDASRHSVAALEAAAELAADLEAELLGLYVEDVNLLHAAALPFTREVRYLARAATELNDAAMQRQLRAQARRVRRALEAVAARLEVAHSFRTVRGRVSAEVLAASAETDLLILGQAGLRYHSRRAMGRTARHLLAEATAPVLMLRHGLRLGTGVFVLDNGSSTSDEALRLAAALARRRADEAMTVLVWADDAETRMKRLRAVQERYGTVLENGRVWPLADLRSGHVARLLREARAGLLVVPAGSPLVDYEDVQEFLAELECPVLVVR
jgi:nucleotide-binding universal stress UspA family protein